MSCRTRNQRIARPPSQSQLAAAVCTERVEPAERRGDRRVMQATADAQRALVRSERHEDSDRIRRDSPLLLLSKGSFGLCRSFVVGVVNYILGARLALR